MLGEKSQKATKQTARNFLSEVLGKIMKLRFWIRCLWLPLLLCGCQHHGQRSATILERNKVEAPSWWVSPEQLGDQRAVLVRRPHALVVFRQFAPPLSAQLATTLDDAQSAAKDHLNSLVSDLVITAASQQGIALPEPQFVELRKIITSLIDGLQRQEITLADLYYERFGEAGGEESADYYRAGMLIEFDRSLPGRLVVKLGALLSSSRQEPLRQLSRHLHGDSIQAISH